MCLSGRTLPCHKQSIEQKADVDERQTILHKEISTTECPQSRVDFYQTLSLLIRMGMGKEEKTPRRGVRLLVKLHDWFN